MNVLSLFDGMSCGKVALDKVGIKITNYYASEIDKYAISVSTKNHPGIVHLGDVVDINPLDPGFPEIDLLIGGSPCQGFSYAGKGLNFEDERSKLFFEYARILKETKPKYFLLENVRMKQEHQDVITELLGVKPIAINSTLVSAQNRYRLYWTNIPGIKEPEDKGLKISSIMLCEGDFDWFSKEKSDYLLRLASLTNKDRKLEVKNKSILSNPITAKRGFFIYSNHLSQNGRICSEKSATLTTGSPNNIIDSLDGEIRVRKLTPIECERLQTLPDNYTEGVSNSQRYKMLGNGWTVDVISHIFKNIRRNDETKD